MRATVLDHRDELTTVIATRTTQTNEVNRCVYVAAGLAVAAADRPGEPVVLVEMGASAGLLLGVDRYRVELVSPDGTVQVLGDPGSPVVCRGADRSPDATRGIGLPPVAGRVGLDLHPVRLDPDSTDSDSTDSADTDSADTDSAGSTDSAEALRWLEACLWPDVPGRVERFRAAVALAHRPARRRGGRHGRRSRARGHPRPRRGRRGPARPPRRPQLVGPRLRRTHSPPRRPPGP